MDENTAASTRHLEKIHKDDVNIMFKLTKYMFEKVYYSKKYKAIICKMCTNTLPDSHYAIILKHLIEIHYSDIPAEFKREGLLSNILSLVSRNRNMDEIRMNTAASTSHFERTREDDINIVFMILKYINKKVWELGIWGLNEDNAVICKMCTSTLPNDCSITLFEHLGKCDVEQSTFKQHRSLSKAVSNFLSISRNMDENTAASTSHLEKTHKYDGIIPSILGIFLYKEVYGLNKDKTVICKMCTRTIPDNNFVTLIKHLMEENHLDNPAHFRLKGLSSSTSSSRNVDENTAASTSHLEKTHEDDDYIVYKLVCYIFNEIFYLNKDKAIICKKCKHNFPDGHGNTLVKHLVENHHSDIPAEIKIKELLNISSSRNVDENTASTSHLENARTSKIEVAISLITHIINEFCNLNKGNEMICTKCKHTYPDGIDFKTIMKHLINNHEEDIVTEAK